MLDTTDAKTGRLSFEEVSRADGVAMTMLLTERCGAGDKRNERPLQQNWWDRRGLTVPDDSSPFFANAASYQAFAPSPRPGIGIAGTPSARMRIINNTTDSAAPGFWSQPSSNHAGGVVAAFCDGRSVFLVESIAPQVYAQLLSSDNHKASEISQVDWMANSYPTVQDGDFR